MLSGVARLRGACGTEGVDHQVHATVLWDVSATEREACRLLGNAATASPKRQRVCLKRAAQGGL
jgi:hypothetical protein